MIFVMNQQGSSSATDLMKCILTPYQVFKEGIGEKLE
jgi:hypothetical protein